MENEIIFIDDHKWNSYCDLNDAQGSKIDHLHKCIVKIIRHLIVDDADISSFEVSVNPLISNSIADWDLGEKYKIDNERKYLTGWIYCNQRMSGVIALYSDTDLQKKSLKLNAILE